jgi:hypothetical protein
MPIDFPDSPSVNDIYTVGTRSWRWTGSVWESVTVEGPTGPTGPSGVISVTGPITNTGTSTEAVLGFDETGFAKLESPTFTGTLTTPIIRLTSTNDASASSTEHAFQAGPTSGTNVIIDGNEIMARNNGVVSSLYVNTDGGTVSVGGQLSTRGGILNDEATNALVASGYNSASGGFANTSRVIMTATGLTSTNPTTRPDGTTLQVGDIWFDFG